MSTNRQMLTEINLRIARITRRIQGLRSQVKTFRDRIKSKEVLIDAYIQLLKEIAVVPDEDVVVIELDCGSDSD